MMALPVAQDEDPKPSGRRDKAPNYGKLISTEIPFVSLDPGDQHMPAFNRRSSSKIKQAALVPQ